MNFSRLRYGWMSLLLLGGGSAFSTESPVWTLTEKGEGYELYRKPSSGGSSLVAFRAIAFLNATPREVATAILDRENRLKWMRDVRELRTVRLPEKGSVIEYSLIKTPFIIKNRDFVIHTHVEADPVNQKFLIVSRSVTDESVPPTSSVRGELSEGRFMIEPGSKAGTAKITADMDVDPKGSVPRWIVNHFQKDWPIGMLRGLTWILQQKVSVLPPDFQPLFDGSK